MSDKKYPDPDPGTGKLHKNKHPKNDRSPNYWGMSNIQGVLYWVVAHIRHEDGALRCSATRRSEDTQLGPDGFTFVLKRCGERNVMSGDADFGTLSVRARYNKQYENFLLAYEGDFADVGEVAEADMPPCVPDDVPF